MLGPINQSIKQFFTWWGKELFALLPMAWQRKLQAADNTLLLELGSDGLRAIWVNASQRVELGVFAVNDSGRTAWQETVSIHVGVSKADCVLVLSPEQCINRHIFLPKQASTNLHQVMGFEMDRYTPFKAELTFFDVLVTKVSAPENQVGVFFVATPKNVLEPMLDKCRFFGLSPNKASCSPTLALPADAARINLLPESMRPIVNQKERLFTAAIALLLLLEVSASLIYPSWVVEGEVTELKTRIAAIKDDVKLVGQMRTSIEHSKAQITSLLNKKTSQPYAIDILAELTKRLPADSWLTDLRLSGNQLNIQGYSENATDLIQLLEDSPLFSNTRFTSPLASNKGLQQAFKIGINIVEVSQ